MLISVINEISKGIDKLIESKIIVPQKKIVIFGLGRYPYAMRTILEHRNYRIFAYLVEDEASRIRERRNLMDFSSRFLNSDRDVISIIGFEDLCSIDCDEYVILYLDNENNNEEHLGLNEKYTNAFCVYDFSNKDITEAIAGGRLITIDEVKNIELQILDYLAEVCREKNLRYWLCGGSLLGAIRHGGIIPWDDDIDIAMPYEDYKVLMTSFPKHPFYYPVGIDVPESEVFIEPFAKIVDNRTVVVENMKTVKRIGGVCIDIFPLVGLPDDDKDRLLFFKKYRELEKCIWQDFYKNDGDISIFEYWVDKQREFLNKYSFDESKHVGIIGTLYDEKDQVSRSAYNETIQKEFDGLNVNIPLGYEEFLVNQYGEDWNIPPKEEDRVLRHDIDAYVKD